MIDAEHGIATIVVRVAEELIVLSLDAALLLINLHAVRHDHVVHALKGVAGCLRVSAHKVEVVGECSNPVLFAELLAILSLCYERNDFNTTAHDMLRIAGVPA